MNGDETAEKKVMDAASSAADGGARQRSSIGFPYMDLDDAIEVAQAIHGNVGQGECDDDQLAAWLGLSAKSSGFRVQVYTARMFGVIEPGASGKIKLSGLGRAAVDPNQARSAKVQSFLNVPLYAKVFENYKGGVLPPAAAFERDIVLLGVAEKQKGRARQVFERAAEQAGFFEQGKNRLVKPGITETGAASPPPPPPPGGGKGGGDGGGDDVDPPSDRPALIEALVDHLPKQGAPFTIEDLADWLRAAEGNLRIIYGIKGRITIEVAKSKR
jgi:hypothetical protein